MKCSGDTQLIAVYNCELKIILSGHLYPLLTYDIKDGAEAILAGPQSIPGRCVRGVELKLPRLKEPRREFDEFQKAVLTTRLEYEKNNELSATKCNLK